MATFLAGLSPQQEAGFNSVCDGRTLAGWQLVGAKGAGYGVKDGVLVCDRGGGGNRLSEREYSDFIFGFEFRLEPGSNSGIPIRAPLSAGPLAYSGMEIQILDDSHPKYANLRPAQYHGSVYSIAAKRGALRPVAQWNEEEIYCRGRQIRVTVNGQVVVDTDLSPELENHPRMLRRTGHIGFRGHNDYVEFRNLRLKELVP